MIVSFVLACLTYITSGVGVAVIALACLVVTLLAVVKVVPGSWITGTVVTGIGGWTVAFLVRTALTLATG